MNKTTLSEQIAHAASIGDFRTVQRLASVGHRLAEITEKESALAKEKAELERALNGASSSASDRDRLRTFSRAIRNGERQIYSRGNLVVEVDLPRTGKVRIAERTAADTMVVLMEHLLAALGLQALEKLQHFRTGRGPLLSKRPEIDFRNSKRDEVYGHRRVPGTDLSVITHSSTLEKVARLKEALRFLGLPPGSYRIAKTD